MGRVARRPPDSINEVIGNRNYAAIGGNDLMQLPIGIGVVHMVAKAILDLRHHQQTSTKNRILERGLAGVLTLDLVERVGQAVVPRNADTLLATGMIESAKIGRAAGGV